jgi:hypothetical protein
VPVLSSEIEALARAVRMVGDRAGPVNQALEAAKLRARRLAGAVPRTGSAGAAAGSLANAATACEDASRHLHAFGDGCRSFADRLAGGGSGGGGGGGGAAETGTVDGGTKGMDAPAHSFRQEDRAGTDAWAREAGIHAGGLSSEQQEVVGRYSASEYREMNDSLRMQGDSGDAGTPVALSEDHRVLDGAMRPLPEDIELVRGSGRSWMPPAYQSNPQAAVGHAFLDRGYLSASARGFDQAPPLNAGDDRLLLRVPAGKGALYIDPISRNRGEDEILLSRDTVMYVHEASQRGGQWFFEIEVVSRRWAEGAGVFVHR